MEIGKTILTAKTYLLFVSVVFVVACNNSNTRIKVIAPSQSGKELKLVDQRVNGTKVIEELKMPSNGKKTFKLDIGQPKFYNLEFEDQTAYLLLHPNEHVTVKENNGQLQIEGSEDSQKLTELYDSLFATRALLDSLRKQYSLSINEEDKQSIEAEFISIMKQHHKYSVGFVLNNLTSLVSVAAAYQEVAPNTYVFGEAKDLQFFKLLSDSLSKYYPKNRHVLALQRNFNSMHKNYKVNQLIGSVDVINESLPDIELPNIDGVMKSLSKETGRFVLLNVWTAGDQVSFKMFPAYKEVYTKYKGKGLSVYNVYVGKSLAEWERIVKFEELSEWTNVADTSFPNSRLLGAYNIQSLPANYLIDNSNSDLVGRNYDPSELNNALSRLLN